MPIQVVDLRCPNCHAEVACSDKECKWCGNPLTITSFNSVYDIAFPNVNKLVKNYRENLRVNPNDPDFNTSIAFCYLKLKMYDEAYNAFSKAIADNFDNSETYFYAAVSLLKGKKAFLHNRAEIDKIIELINAANMIEPRGIYYYMLAYIKYDYFKRKYLNTTPTYIDYLKESQNWGCSDVDINIFYSAAGIDPINMI